MNITAFLEQIQSLSDRQLIETYNWFMGLNTLTVTLHMQMDLVKQELSYRAV
jgi:hypothetical protein